MHKNTVCHHISNKMKKKIRMQKLLLLKHHYLIDQLCILCSDTFAKCSICVKFPFGVCFGRNKWCKVKNLRKTFFLLNLVSTITKIIICIMYTGHKRTYIETITLKLKANCLCLEVLQYLFNN